MGCSNLKLTFYRLLHMLGSAFSRPAALMNPPHHPGMVMIPLRFLPLALCLSLLPAHAFSQLVNGRLISSVYTWEKFDTVGVSEKFGRGYGSLLLDITQAQFSLHTHLQGAINLQKTLDETADFRAWYLYGQWKDIAGAVDLSFGRLPYFAGVGSGTLDGLLSSIDLAGDAVRLTLYGGAPTPADLALNGWKPLNNNFVAGGQMVTTAVSGMRLGLSYMNRRREHISYWTTRPDSLYNPIATYVTPEADRQQYAAVDASYRLSKARLYGRFDYNVEDNTTQRAQAGIRLDLNERLECSGEYIYRSPHIPFGSFFSIFPTEAISEFEAGLDYHVTPAVSAFARGALVQYDEKNSFRYTAGLRHQYLYLFYRGNSGYAGELSAVTVQGAYPLLDRMVIPNVSLSFSSYRLSSDAGRENALAAAFGSTLRPWQVLAIDLQVQWLRNKVFEHDVRFLATLNFWFSERFHLFD
jgi:hypothetical protein